MPNLQRGLPHPYALAAAPCPRRRRLPGSGVGPTALAAGGRSGREHRRAEAAQESQRCRPPRLRWTPGGQGPHGRVHAAARADAGRRRGPARAGTASRCRAAVGHRPACHECRTGRGATSAWEAEAEQARHAACDALTCGSCHRSGSRAHRSGGNSFACREPRRPSGGGRCPAYAARGCGGPGGRRGELRH